MNLYQKDVIMRILFAFLLICLSFSTGCYYDSKENLYPVLNCTDTVNVTYTAKIKPILDARCNNCHYSGASNVQNVILDTYPGVVDAVNNRGLYSSITQDGKVPAMPNTGGKLSDCEIAAISIWINAKTPKN